MRHAIVASVLITSALTVSLLAGRDDAGSAADEAALERARNTVRMLDDVYKSTVVLITDRYVNDVDDYPAGSAAIELFDAISKKGWHKVRLIDASGQPYDDENTARDEFEKNGVKQLKLGKSYYEQTIERDGERYLRAMTPVPVVMEKCVMCHSHYADAKKGEPIGAIAYTVRIE